MEKEMIFRGVLGDNPVLSENRDLLSVAEHYFALSLNVQNLYASLQKLVKKARNHPIIMDSVLAHAEESHLHLSEKECRETIDELRLYWSAAGGSLISCMDEFRTVHRLQVEMQSKLGVLKRKLKYRRGLMRGCSVAAGIVNRLTTNLKFAQPRLRDLCEGDRWFKSLRRFTSQQVLVEHLNRGTFFICKDMESMKALVDRLDGQLARISTSIDFGERHGNSCALLLATAQIRNKRCGFLNELEEFERQINACNKTICNARTAVLQKLRARRNPLMEGN